MEEPRGTKYESLIRTVCYRNEMDNVCAGKELTF